MRNTIIVFTGMALLGIVFGIFLRLPLPPLTSPTAPQEPTREELTTQTEAIGKLKVAAVILNIVEGAANASPTNDTVERVRGQYLQALTEFEQRQWRLSLDHTLAAIASLNALYETLLSSPLE